MTDYADYRVVSRLGCYQRFPLKPQPLSSRTVQSLLKLTRTCLPLATHLSVGCGHYVDFHYTSLPGNSQLRQAMIVAWPRCCLDEARGRMPRFVLTQMAYVPI